ncbi:GPCR kinase [Tanacetum coccineum]
MLARMRILRVGHGLGAVEFVNANGGGIANGCLGDIENYLKNGKLEQVVAIIKSCTPNAIGDLTVTLKDLSGTIHGTIHHKVIDERGYGNDITVRSDLILANVFVFSPKPSMHLLNITMRNVVKVFHKDSVPGNDSGVGGSGMLMEEEEIVKLMEKEMADLELQVCWNVTHQEMAIEEALNMALEEEARQPRADQEWLEKSEGGRALGALGALGANKSSTPLGVVKAACVLEVDAMGALDLVEVEAVGSSSSSSSLDM